MRCMLLGLRDSLLPAATLGGLIWKNATKMRFACSSSYISDCLVQFSCTFLRCVLIWLPWFACMHELASDWSVCECENCVGIALCRNEGISLCTNVGRDRQSSSISNVVYVRISMLVLLSDLSGGCLPNQQAHWLEPQQQHAPAIHNVLTRAIRCIARYGVCAAPAKPCKACCCLICRGNPELCVSYRLCTQHCANNCNTTAAHAAVLVCSEACGTDMVCALDICCYDRDAFLGQVPERKYWEQ